jgi:DNA-binding transcriptional LysR family regulator
MNMDGLESFLAVVANKSISNASKALHIKQPTLSTRIRKLEEELDFILLNRS